MSEKIEVKKAGFKMDKRLISCIIALIGSIMLIATLFLPFASATEKYREQLEKFPDTMYAEEIGMTNKDAVNISLFEFGKIYSSTAAAQNAQAVSITCVIMISAFAIFALLSAIFSLLKKPIAIMIFNVLSLATFLLLKWDFNDRGVLPSSRYDCGMAQYFCYFGVAIVFVGAIIMLLIKINQNEKNSITYPYCNVGIIIDSLRRKKFQ